MQRKTAITISHLEDGLAVLDLLSRRFTYRSRAEWQEQIYAGAILLSGEPARPATIVSAGDTLQSLCQDRAEPPVETNFTIIHEDRQLLVIDKPANLPCHPGGRYFNHTLWAILQEELNLDYLCFINRIDRETSGIVLVAKTAEAARVCRQQFDQRQAFKRYLALVEGDFPDTLEADGWLSRDPESLIRNKRRFHPATSSSDDQAADRQTCRTSFRRLAAADNISLAEAIPATGRCHQIRASLCSLGFPVVGDKIYGIDETIFLRFLDDTLTAKDRDRLRLGRQALHGTELAVNHPQTGRRHHFTAPLPADMRAFFPKSTAD